jgi:flagellar assembly protein FliH
MSDTNRLRAIAAAAAAAAERWPLPAVDGPIVGSRRPAAVDPQAALSLAAAEETARARGHEAGLTAGRAEIEQQVAELEERVRRLDAVLALLARPLEQLDAEVEYQLTLLALSVGRQLVRRELRVDPAQVIAVIRDAVGRLPVAARDVRVQLHPEDAATVREHLAEPALERAWSIVEDPTQSRGGCLVRTETSQIDARFESRVQAIVASVFGDERAVPRAEYEAAPEYEDDADQR